MTEDIFYSNQVIYCKANNLPMFAPSSCDHVNPWTLGNTAYKGRIKSQTFGEIMKEVYGDRADVVSISTHVVGCPICGKSWCD